MLFACQTCCRRSSHSTAQTPARVVASAESNTNTPPRALSLTPLPRLTDALQVAPTKPKAPLLLSPPPAPVLPVHLRTPSPGLQRLAALSHQISPEASLELEQDLEDEEEVDCEDEVEYAGASAADYGQSCLPRGCEALLIPGPEIGRAHV